MGSSLAPPWSAPWEKCPARRSCPDSLTLSRSTRDRSARRTGEPHMPEVDLTTDPRHAPQLTRRPRRSWTHRLDWLGTLARLVLGARDGRRGALKVTHPGESARGPGLSTAALRGVKLVGYGLPLLEIIIGALLLLGLLTRAPRSSPLLMAPSSLASPPRWARGLSIDCGCFGGGGTIDKAATAYPLELARDTALLLTGAYLCWRPRSALSLDRRWYGH